MRIHERLALAHPRPNDLGGGGGDIAPVQFRVFQSVGIDCFPIILKDALHAQDDLHVRRRMAEEYVEAGLGLCRGNLLLEDGRRLPQGSGLLLRALAYAAFRERHHQSLSVVPSPMLSSLLF